MKHFIWSALDYALRDSGYDESLRCGHYEGKARVTEWMKSQPQEPMHWSVLTTGPYAQMLSASLRPSQDAEGTYVFRAPLNDGAVPFIHLDDLALYVRWIINTPEESVGLNLKIATEHVGYAYLAESFTAATGKPARYENITVEEYLAHPSNSRILGAVYEGEKDNTLMTARENFAAWWRIYQRCTGNKGVIQRDYTFLDRILPGRVKLIREWIEKTAYTGDQLPLLDNGS